MIKIINESPDDLTISGSHDLYDKLMTNVVTSLCPDDLNWDSKGTKYTLRFPDEDVRTVVVTPSGKSAVKVYNARSKVSQEVKLSGNFNNDKVSVENAINSI